MSTVTLSDAKTHLPRLLAEVSEIGERIIITRSGRPAGVLLSIEEYDGLVETLEILADPDLSQAVRQGKKRKEDPILHPPNRPLHHLIPFCQS